VQAKTYVEIVATTAGGSAFVEHEVGVVERPVASGTPPMHVGTLAASTSAVFVRSTSFDSEAHPAPRKQWAVMLRGAIEVTVTDGSRRRFGPGDLVLASDTSGSGHITRAVEGDVLEALFLPVE